MFDVDTLVDAWVDKYQIVASDTALTELKGRIYSALNPAPGEASRNSALEDAAQIAEAWVPVVNAKFNDGEISRTEWMTNKACVAVIANKIRQQKTA